MNFKISNYNLTQDTKNVYAICKTVKLSYKSISSTFEPFISKPKNFTLGPILIPRIQKIPTFALSIMNLMITLIALVEPTYFYDDPLAFITTKEGDRIL